MGKILQVHGHLLLFDGYSGDGGTLNSWGLNFCTTQPLSINTNQINDLVLYPNQIMVVLIFNLVLTQEMILK